MDQPIQIEQNVRVQIIDNINGEHSRSLLYPIHMGKVISLERSEQMHRLLIIIILEDLLQKFLNLYLLLFDHVVYDGLHPGEVSVHVASLLAFHVLCTV